MICALREKINAFESDLTYYPYLHQSSKNKALKLKENSNFVDGIGGVLWEGALVMSYLIDKMNLNCHVLELGCGAGLTGLQAAVSGCKVTLTDRCCDLAEENISRLKQQYLNEESLDVSSIELSWGEGNESKLLDLQGSVDVIIGAEIACLRKQQENLINTIQKLAGPYTVVLLSYDDIPMPSNCGSQRFDKNKSSNDMSSNEGCSTHGNDNNNFGIDNQSVRVQVSKYEQEMNDRMKGAGFHSLVICTATVDWRKETNITGSDTSQFKKNEKVDETNLKKSYAVLYDTTQLHYNEVDKICLPNLCHVKEIDELTCGNDDHKSVTNEYSSEMANSSSSSSSSPSSSTSSPSFPPSSCPSPSFLHSSSLLAHHTHHVTAYYRPSAARICSRCHKHFFSSLNNTTGCFHHPGYYVCRYHPAELNLSINGGGDHLGYYGNGKEGWEAKFWDCCGNEDINASGCKNSCHLTY